ncbi:AAA family ATPase [Thalassotalea sediminis]|uniref:AAA family ATPase n=1 Tax=Thalassotalea sediminis TaxID=1759089 RepID=UPI002573932C|nr:AAA family ATPase [Thalassotalea sediminis]
MYTAYFGLSEAPFTIAPDPAYLFLSDRHREALSHLTYGLGDNGGFVLLTGEVGTGKTTISRTVMEKLPENTQLAFILNPTLSCEELLATICDNLKIRYKKTGATLKYLTDKIQNKLLTNHEQGINTLVIIDEAQHLQPEVLEQLRLLTNLETNTQKLLQVILIGQPELQQLLQRRDLRQLAQRITARYHLMPLTKQELNSYIQHRLSVAQCTRNLFNKSAISAIHKISNGIPRVVNLLCDRALVLAYSQNQTVVNKKIVIEAARDALGQEVEPTIWQARPIRLGLIFTLLTVTLFAGIWAENTWHLFKVEQSSSTINMGEVNKNQAKFVDNENAESSVKKPVPAKDVQKSDKELANHTEIAQAIDSTTDVPAKQSLPEKKVLEKEQAPIVLGFNAEAYKKQQQQNTQHDEIKVAATDGVSAEVLELFKQAVEDTRADSNDLEVGQHGNHIADFDSVTALHQMPADFQDAIPPISFELHMFETEGNGWVRVNGQDFKEGETIANGVVLEAILPQKVILSFRKSQFSMPALSSW